MTVKEAIELLKDFKAMTGQAVGEDIIEPIEQALTELDELKRDVTRYFGLQYKNQFSSMIQNEIHEMYVLRDKLMKVGKEE